ncbi:MAG TPA: NAD-dependent succinate-semialdehyde dehydrogenase [Baekduia sp.]|jgi:succinate-semialdehyde dehydrogenase/glutarate-semialdehyde dehydrogenase
MTVVHAPDVLEGVPLELLVGGAWRPSASGQTFDVHDPATGEVLASIADAMPGDGMAALDAAAAAQSGWAAVPARERSEILRRAFDLVVVNRERIARLIASEMGKPVAEAYGEVDYGAEFLRWFAEEAVRHSGDYRRSPDGASRILVSRRPIGPCLLITPWNFPLAMATRKIAAALAAGCTVVLKPAPETPLTSLLFARLLQEAGVPDGVVNVVTTSDAPALCAPLIADGRIRKVSFTGSTPVGRLLVAQCGPQLVRPSMELGGNAPFIVLADADLDAAVEGAMIAKMRNMGEACTAANRFLVEASVADEFARLLGERMGRLRLGHGLDAGTEVGPLIDEAAQDRLGELVADAVAHGASVRVGGAAPERAGWFFAPTVLENVPAEARVSREEIFGPVAPITTFTEVDEAIRIANDTEFGLVAYLYTGDPARALRLAERLETGMVALNRGLVSNAAAPFGGIKHSGMGREGGREGIEDYLDITYVAVDA